MLTLHSKVSPKVYVNVHMRKLGIILFFAGLLLVLGSCAGMAVGISRSFQGRHAHALPFTLAEEISSKDLLISTENQAQFGIYLDIRSDSVQESNSEFGAGRASSHAEAKRHYQARYRFPFCYVVRDELGSVLMQESGIVAWDSKPHAYSLSSSSASCMPRDCSEVVTAWMNHFVAPPSGKISVTFELKNDMTYGASLKAGELRILENTRPTLELFGYGILGLCMGWCLLSIGTVAFFVGHAAAFKAGRTREGALPAIRP